MGKRKSQVAYYIKNNRIMKVKAAFANLNKTCSPANININRKVRTLINKVKFVMFYA